MSEMDTSELTDLAEQIDARSTELSETIESGEFTEADVTEVEDLAAAFEQINDVVLERDTEQAALRERAEAARQRIAGGEATAEGVEAAAADDEDEDEDEDEMAADAEAPAEAPVEGAEGAEVEAEAPAEAAAAVEPAVEAAPAAPAPVHAQAAVTPPAPKQRARTLAQRLNNRQSARTSTLAPTAADTGNGSMQAGLMSTGFTPGIDPGTSIQIDALAKAIVEKHNRMGVVPAGISQEFVALATAEMPHERNQMMLAEDPERNYVMFRQVQDMVTLVASGQPIDHLVASGGPCAPFPARYDIFRLAQPHDPMERKLPSLGAPRAGIRYTIPPDFREARAGIGVVSCEEDAAGYGSGSGQATPKPCVHLDCPEVVECCVETVSRCIEFGNLQFRAFPEWVEARVMDLMVEFQSVKEVLYLDVIDDPANSIQATTDPASGYGAMRRILNDVRKAAVAYRRRNGMDDGAPLDWCAPGWLPEVMLADAINDHSLGLAQLELAIASMEAAFRRMGVSVSWYYDSATGADQAFSAAQADGPLNDYPEDAVSYLFAPGTFIRLDGGQLDLGIVRDSVLNRTNDLQIFAEEWTQVCKLGIESVRIEHQGVCPNGAAPEPAALIVCGEGGSGS